MAVHMQWLLAETMSELITDVQITDVFAYLAEDFVDHAEAWSWVTRRNFGHGNCVYIHSHNSITVRVFHNPDNPLPWGVVVFRFTHGGE